MLLLIIALMSLILVLLPSLLIVLLILLWMLLDFLGFPRFSSAAAGVTAAADQRPGAWGVVDVMGVVGGLPRTFPRARGVVHLESSVFDRGKFNVYTPATRTRTVGFYFIAFIIIIEWALLLPFYSADGHCCGPSIARMGTAIALL